MNSKQSNEEKHLQKMKERFKNVGNTNSKVISEIFSKNFNIEQCTLSDKKIIEKDELISSIYSISNEKKISSELKIEKILLLIRQSNLDYQ